ncbi:monoamine oxidase [Sarocladium strictum]
MLYELCGSSEESYAGLSAARVLKEHKKNILVLEARDRIGGRCWTKHYDDGSYEDYGGMFLGFQQENMHRLAAELKIPVYPVNLDGKCVLRFRGVTKAYNSKMLPPIPILALLDASLLIKRFERLSERINLEEPWKSRDAERIDNITLDEWLRSKAWTKTGLNIARLPFELILGFGLSQVSLLHAAWFCKSGTSLTVLSTIENGAQMEMTAGGGQAIADGINHNLGNIVRLSEPLLSVDQSNSYAVRVQTSKGTYEASHIIMAVPPQAILGISFTPSLPAEKLKLGQNMPMGQYWKVLAKYSRPFWRQDGLRGEAINMDGFLSWVSDVSPMDSCHGLLVGLFGGRKAITFLGMSEEERQETILQELVACFGNKAALPDRLSIHSMMYEEWLNGCPVAVPSPGTWTSLGPWLRKPCGRIHWAGTETSTRWSGYMEGAVISGIRAAKEVISVQPEEL